MKYSSSKLEEWESDSSEVAKLSRLTLPPELGKESVLNKWLFQPLSRPIDSLINPIFFRNYQIKFKIQWKDSTLILRDPFYVSLCLNSKAFNKSHHCFYSYVIMWNLLRGALTHPSLKGISRKVVTRELVYYILLGTPRSVQKCLCLFFVFRPNDTPNLAADRIFGLLVKFWPI